MKTTFVLFFSFLATGLSHANTARVSFGLGGAQPNGASFVWDITPDGRFVVFSSFASNLVAGDSNDVQDVFVHDRDSGVIERVSLSSSGAEGNGASNEASISDDGRYVCFTSTATNLVAGDTNGLRDVFLRDRDTSQTYRLSEAPGGVDGNGASTGGRISGNGDLSLSRLSPATSSITTPTG